MPMYLGQKVPFLLQSSAAIVVFWYVLHSVSSGGPNKVMYSDFSS
jgi:hypothetical protein